MRIKNNTDVNKRKTETAADIGLALILVLFAAVSFAAGYYTASVQIAAMLAAQ